ncbi:hypothetical protein N9091_01425 [bacterium]|nr:hypothetical protein [bacterium]
MKKLIINYISTIGFLIFGNNAFGSPYLNELQTGNFDAFQKKERVEIAIRLSKNLDRLSTYIPNVQPDDIKWHEEELQAIRELQSIDSSAANKRIVDLSYNLIHQKRKIRNQIKNLQSALDCIQSKEFTIKQEILCWAVVSHNLSDSSWDGAILILIREGLISEESLSKSGIVWSKNDGEAWNLVWYSRGIIEYLIIPYLQGSLFE